MDRKLSSAEELERWVRLASASRSQLSHEIVTLKRRLDVPTRLKSSLKAHPSRWITGSVLSGLGASLLFRRKSNTAPLKQRSFPLAAAGLILTAVRPLLKVWLADQVKNYVSGSSTRRPPAGSSRPSTPSY
jgi:hypothetical protein